MFDPLRAKARVLITIALGFMGGLALASGLGWTGPSYAMPAVARSPQVSEEAVRPALDLSEAFANAAESVTPAVVRIEITRTRTERGIFGGQARERTEQGGGSGFIISDDGYILTNEHVVGDADDIRVYLNDGRYFDADVVGSDRFTDVAVVKIDESGLPTLSLGNSEALRVGEWVLAIGNPGFGGGASSADALDYTVTAGIVSAKGRPLTLLQRELQRDPEFDGEAGFAIEDYIQTDAVINQGNSGGPMVNVMGEVVGINSAIFSPTGTYVGYGFAIPIDLASRVMEDLIEYGSVRRAWLGVQITEITPEDQEAYGLPRVAGVLVQVATDGGPAEDAGLRRGDVIYSVEGTVVGSTNGLQNLIAQRRPNEEVTVRIYRDGAARDITIRLGEAPLAGTLEPEPMAEEVTAGSKLGIGVRVLTPELANEIGYEEAGGVIISQVTPAGPAARRDIVPGMKLIEVNGQAVETPEDVSRILADVADRQIVSLVVGFPNGDTRLLNLRAGG
jgi:serine protease Do